MTALLAKHVAEILVLASVNGGPAEAKDVFAKASQEVTLHAAVVARRGRRCTLYTNAPKPKTRCRVAPLPEDVRTRWSKIEPTKPWYNNVPAGGFKVAPIAYASRTIAETTPSIRADYAPLQRRGIGVGGTMRYAVRVTLADGSEHTSAAPDGAYDGGVPAAKDARRVTWRRSDDYLGYLTELGNVPYVFGSANIGRERHQAERGVGVDCADLMVYGLRRLGHDVPYVSSRTMGPHSRAVVGPVEARRGKVYVDADGEPIAVGEGGLRPGDWIIFDGHVGAFYADAGTKGVFDADDWMIHTAWAEVAIQRMDDTHYGRQPFSVRRAKALTRSVSLAP
ncbi:MAG: hypothetical protein RIT81_16680 [Deltaproteobacteria bacterium]